MVKLFTILGAFFIASPAFACGVMEKADPRVGSTVSAADHVTLHFSEAFDPTQSNVTISDESGGNLSVTKSAASGNNLSILFGQPLPAGKYKVAWDVLWLDCGSKTQGDYKFTVKNMDMSH